MSRTIKKYTARDRRNRYAPIPDLELEDSLYTATSKSHDRKIRKKGNTEKAEDSDGTLAVTEQPDGYAQEEG